jgi:hypothetical protein
MVHASSVSSQRSPEQGGSLHLANSATADPMAVYRVCLTEIDPSAPMRLLQGIIQRTQNEHLVQTQRDQIDYLLQPELELAGRREFTHLRKPLLLEDFVVDVYLEKSAKPAS